MPAADLLDASQTLIAFCSMVSITPFARIAPTLRPNALISARQGDFFEKAMNISAFISCVFNGSIWFFTPWSAASARPG
jgi:hypothetical protein